MSHRARLAIVTFVATLSIALGACSSTLQVPAAKALPPSNSLVILEYEAWFAPRAATFQTAEAMPILQSKVMQPVGGGYDSTDPHVIAQHLKWMEYMGVDAVTADVSNNVGCIFSTGTPSAKFCNPASASFRESNRIIRDNTGNLYPAWSKLRSPVKLIPLLGCLSSLDLHKGLDGKSGFQKEIEYFGRLMKQYPELNVVYAGHPLMLAYVGTPVDPAILDGARSVLRESGLATQYTFRIVGGYLDAQPTFWADPSERPDGPVKIAPRYGFWSFVDRYKPGFGYYPTYSTIPGSDAVENFTVSIATAGHRGWGCPRPKICADVATRYGPTGHNYVTLEAYMKLAAQLRPAFLIIHQFNEFVRPDEGWNAQTSDDSEPTQFPGGWGYSGIDAIRNAISAYRRER
ncbi:MAG TPA: hypothetical protein VGK84_00510 [Candidatus Tumulicola sp.]|jgi:hypothetical protein